MSACREHCGACCIAPSIELPLPGMPQGKPAGVPCIHLDAQYRCKLFGLPSRPSFCAQFLPDPSVCGESRAEAITLLNDLESHSSP